LSPAPLIKPEEIDLVKQYIILPILLRFLEQDIATLDNLQLNLSLVVVANFKTEHRNTLKEIATLKKQLWKCGIKVIEREETDISLTAKYLCRGFNHEMNLLWSFVRAQIAIKFSGDLKVDLTDGE